MTLLRWRPMCAVSKLDEHHPPTFSVNYSALVWPPSMSITEPLMNAALGEHR